MDQATKLGLLLAYVEFKYPDDTLLHVTVRSIALDTVEPAGTYTPMQKPTAWVQVDGKWIEYTGTTHIRNLYYRAIEASRIGARSFFVHDFNSKPTGLAVAGRWRELLKCTSIDDVPLAKLPDMIQL